MTFKVALWGSDITSFVLSSENKSSMIKNYDQGIAQIEPGYGAPLKIKSVTKTGLLFFGVNINDRSHCNQPSGLDSNIGLRLVPLAPANNNSQYFCNVGSSFTCAFKFYTGKLKEGKTPGSSDLGDYNDVTEANQIAVYGSPSGFSSAFRFPSLGQQIVQFFVHKEDSVLVIPEAIMTTSRIVTADADCACVEAYFQDATVY